MTIEASVTRRSSWKRRLRSYWPYLLTNVALLAVGTASLTGGDSQLLAVTLATLLYVMISVANGIMARREMNPLSRFRVSIAMLLPMSVAIVYDACHAPGGPIVLGVVLILYGAIGICANVEQALGEHKTLVIIGGGKE